MLSNERFTDGERPFKQSPFRHDCGGAKRTAPLLLTILGSERAPMFTEDIFFAFVDFFGSFTFEKASMLKIRAEIVARMEDCFLELFALFRIDLTCPEFAMAAQHESVRMIRRQTALEKARVRAGSSQ
jgi:hypothetical protein